MDFAFKRIFGTEKYKAATIGLLNSIIPGKNIRDVSFLNFDIDKCADIIQPLDKYTLTYICRETDSGAVLPSSPEFHFIEIEKFRKNKPRIISELGKWLYLLSSASDLKEIPQEFSGSTAFDAYFNAASTAAFSKDELSIYIKDMTTKWDIELAMKEHYRDGREEGLQEGLQQGREDAVAEMARRMLGLGLTLDTIAQATGLTPEQIQAL